MVPYNNIPRGVQFTKGGPEIPRDLLNDLEAGNVVVFCGAGISRQCGLPDFKGLVENICKKLGQELAKDEQILFDNREYDAVLGLIESRIGPSPVRKALKEVLQIEEGADIETHKSLLKLATSKNRVRLVTTNFDDAFEKISKGTPDSSFDYAPYLPLPNRDWNSVVNLHGGLRNSKDKDGRTLVVTSADFGRAYITEGWASRFLVELFRRTSAGCRHRIHPDRFQRTVLEESRNQADHL